MPESIFPVLATYISPEPLRRRWREGSLSTEWAAAYPEVFDKDDLRIANTQAHLGYHYFEWLAAILLFHTQGFLSLVEKYAFRSHARKRRVIERICDPLSVEFILGMGRESKVQCPDLLIFKPDGSDWSFCEVKGPSDRLRQEQVTLFAEITGATGKAVHVVEFREAPAVQGAG